MNNGNVGPGQMMGQWNNFEAPNYNPEYKNLDPTLSKTEDAFEQKIEQRAEQLSDDVNRANEVAGNAYGHTAILGKPV